MINALPACPSPAPDDISHLEGLKMYFPLEDKNYPGRVIKIHVTFSSHVFSESVSPDELEGGSSIFEDENKKQRIWSKERYVCSKILPESIERAVQENTPVYVSRPQYGKENFGYIVLNKDNKISDKSKVYTCFFYLYPASIALQTPVDLIFRVVSAYIAPPPSRNQKGQKIKSRLKDASYSGKRKP